MANVKKPTGTGFCPEDIRRAKGIARDILAKAHDGNVGERNAHLDDDVVEVGIEEQHSCIDGGNGAAGNVGDIEHVDEQPKSTDLSVQEEQNVQEGNEEERGTEIKD